MFVEFGKKVGVAGCDCDVCGTRQGSSSCGGGDHYVKVDGFVSGEKGDVRPVEVVVVVFCVLCWVVVGVGRVRNDDLFGEGAVSGDTVDELDQVAP